MSLFTLLRPCLHIVLDFQVGGGEGGGAFSLFWRPSISRPKYCHFKLADGLISAFSPGGGGGYFGPFWHHHPGQPLTPLLLRLASEIMSLFTLLRPCLHRMAKAWERDYIAIYITTALFLCQIRPRSGFGTFMPDPLAERIQQFYARSTRGADSDPMFA